MRRIGWMLSAAAAAVLAAGALARAPFVSPSSGGIGRTVTLTGLAVAPVRKPRVRLVPHPGETGLKTVNMRVVTYTSTEIDAQVTAGRAGVYDVLVKPADRGATAFTLADTFTILEPAPASIDAASGGPGTVVTIRGSMFGTPKGKVTIGGRKAKVKSWADDTIVAVVPKSAPGAQPVVVADKAGPSDGQMTFDVTGSATGGGGGKYDEFLRADLSGKGHFEITNAKPQNFNVSYDAVAQQLTFGGTNQPAKGFPDLLISMLPLDVTRATPYVVGTLPAPPVITLATMTYTEANPTTKIHIASAGSLGAALAVTITGWDGTFLEGTFTATLVDGQLGGTPAIDVTNGSFRVRRATGH